MKHLYLLNLFMGYMMVTMAVWKITCSEWGWVVADVACAGLNFFCAYTNRPRA